MTAYEIPSAEIALHFARLMGKKRHDLSFDYPGPGDLPRCKACGREITADQWAAMEECDGAPVSGLREGDDAGKSDPARLYRHLLGVPVVPLQREQESI